MTRVINLRRTFLMVYFVLLILSAGCLDYWRPAPPDLDGSPAWLTGGLGDSPGQFQEVSAVTVDKNGAIVVADNQLRRLTWISDAGRPASVIFYGSDQGVPAISDGSLSAVGALMSRDDILYIGSPEGVWAYSETGSRRIFEPTLSGQPRAFSVGEGGIFYLATVDEVSVHSGAGEMLRSWRLEGESGPSIRDVAVSPQGQVYVAASGWNQVIIFSREGKEVRRIPPANDQPSSFQDLRAMTVDEDGFLYVYDRATRLVTLMDPEGNELTRIGGRGSAPGKILRTARLVVDDAGDRLVVADSSNYRIQVFDLTGEDGSANDYVVHNPEFPATSRPDHIVMTLGSDPNSERRVAWRTAPETTGSVLQIAPIERTQEVHDVNWESAAVKEVEGKNTLVQGNLGGYVAHEVTVTGLAPGLSYVYRVGDGEENWSLPQTTQVVRSDEGSTRTVILGDSRNRMDVWEQIVKASSVHEPAFIINTGDLVADGENMNDWSPWFDRAKDVIGRIPLMSCMGNHESQSPNYFHAFALPANGPTGLLEQAYSFDYGPVHWVVLNTTTELEPQTSWLESDLAATEKPWIFAVFHRPAYAGHPTRGDGNLDVREAWVPILEKYGVALAWQGHDHYYFRTKPVLKGETVEMGAGTIYVTTGGSGAPLYPIEKNKYAETAESVDHYCVVDVTEENLKVAVYRADESLLDEFSLQKRASRRMELLNRK